MLLAVGSAGFAQLGEPKSGDRLSKNRLKDGLSADNKKRLEKYLKENEGKLPDASRVFSRIYQAPGSETYHKLYETHVHKRYGMVAGKPMPLNFQVSGVIEVIPDNRTLILNKCQVRYINMARVEKRLGVFEQTNSGVFPDSRTLAVQVDDTKDYQVGQRFLDRKKRRLADAGTFEYETKKWGVLKAKYYQSVPELTYEQFAKFYEEGRRFSPKTDWEIWAEEHGKL